MRTAPSASDLFRFNINVGSTLAYRIPLVNTMRLESGQVHSYFSCPVIFVMHSLWIISEHSLPSGVVQLFNEQRRFASFPLEDFNTVHEREITAMVMLPDNRVRLEVYTESPLLVSQFFDEFNAELDGFQYFKRV